MNDAQEQQQRTRSRSSDPGDRLRGTLTLSKHRGRSYIEYDPPNCEKFERHHHTRASFSCGLFSPPEGGHESPASTRPNKVRKAPLSTREHALALAAALTTKIPERVEGWPQTGLKADQRANIESFLAAEAEAAASESLDKVPPLIPSEEADLEERPSQRSRRSFGGFFADTLSSQSRIRRRSASGFVSPERCSPSHRWSFFRFSTQGKSPVNPSPSSLPTSPTRGQEPDGMKLRRRASSMSEQGEMSGAVFNLSPIRTSIAPSPEVPSLGRRASTGAQKGDPTEQQAVSKSLSRGLSMKDSPASEKRLWNVPSLRPPVAERSPWSAPNSPPRADKNGVSSPPTPWRGPKNAPLKGGQQKNTLASPSSVPNKAWSPGGSPQASLSRSTFKDPPAFRSPKMKGGFPSTETLPGKRASEPVARASMLSPEERRGRLSTPVSPRGNRTVPSWKAKDSEKKKESGKAKVSEKPKTGEVSRGGHVASHGRILSPPPKRTLSHETEDLLWTEQVRKKNKMLSPVKSPGGEKRVGRAEDRPRWNEPLWSKKARQRKVSLSPCGKKGKVKVRKVSKSPVRKADSAKKRSKRKSNNVEQPLLDTNDSSPEKGRLSDADGNPEFKLLGSALEAVVGTTSQTLAAETPLETGGTKQTPLRNHVSKPKENGIEIDSDVELPIAEPVEESPTPVKEQRRLKSPDFPNRYEPRSTSAKEYENPLFDITISSEKMSDVITTAAQKQKGMESIEELPREGGIGRGRPNSPPGFHLTGERSVNKPEGSTDSVENWLTRQSITRVKSNEALSNEETWLVAAEEREEELLGREDAATWKQEGLEGATWKQEGLEVPTGKLTVAEWLKELEAKEPEGGEYAGKEGKESEALALGWLQSNAFAEDGKEEADVEEAVLDMNWSAFVEAGPSEDGSPAAPLTGTEGENGTPAVRTSFLEGLTIHVEGEKSAGTVDEAQVGEKQPGARQGLGKSEKSVLKELNGELEPPIPRRTSGDREELDESPPQEDFWTPAEVWAIQSDAAQKDQSPQASESFRSPITVRARRARTEQEVNWVSQSQDAVLMGSVSVSGDWPRAGTLFAPPGESSVLGVLEQGSGLGKTSAEWGATVPSAENLGCEGEKVVAEGLLGASEGVSPGPEAKREAANPHKGLKEELPLSDEGLGGPSGSGLARAAHLASSDFGKGAFPDSGLEGSPKDKGESRSTSRLGQSMEGLNGLSQVKNVGAGIEKQVAFFETEVRRSREQAIPLGRGRTGTGTNRKTGPRTGESAENVEVEKSNGTATETAQGFRSQTDSETGMETALSSPHSSRELSPSLERVSDGASAEREGRTFDADSLEAEFSHKQDTKEWTTELGIGVGSEAEKEEGPCGGERDAGQEPLSTYGRFAEAAGVEEGEQEVLEEDLAWEMLCEEDWREPVEVDLAVKSEGHAEVGYEGLSGAKLGKETGADSDVPGETIELRTGVDLQGQEDHFQAGGDALLVGESEFEGGGGEFQGDESVLQWGRTKSRSIRTAKVKGTARLGGISDEDETAEENGTAEEDGDAEDGTGMNVDGGTADVDGMGEEDGMSDQNVNTDHEETAAGDEMREEEGAAEEDAVADGIGTGDNNGIADENIMAEANGTGEEDGLTDEDGLEGDDGIPEENGAVEESMADPSPEEEADTGLAGALGEGHVEDAEEIHVESQDAQIEEEAEDVESTAATGQANGPDGAMETEDDVISVSCGAMQAPQEQIDVSMTEQECGEETFANEDALPSPEYEPVYPVRYREPPPHPAIQIVKVGGILANAAVKTGVGLSVITLQQCGLLAKITTTLIVDDAKRITSGLFKCTVGRLFGFD